MPPTLRWPFRFTKPAAVLSLTNLASKSLVAGDKGHIHNGAVRLIGAACKQGGIVQEIVEQLGLAHVAAPPFSPGRQCPFLSTPAPAWRCRWGQQGGVLYMESFSANHLVVEHGGGKLHGLAQQVLQHNDNGQPRGGPRFSGRRRTAGRSGSRQWAWRGMQEEISATKGTLPVSGSWCHTVP